jgi:hypothetical protein
MTERLANFQLQLDQRFDAVYRALDSYKDLLSERYATQTKGADERFEAQQLAMKTAFDAADKAVQAALAAAEKAANKAEAAADDRFKAVNEFRGQLADQAATLLSRVEFAAQFNSLVEKVDALSSRIADIDKRLTAVQASGAGAESVTGTGFEQADLINNSRIAREALAKVQRSQLIAIASFVVALISVVSVIYIHTK